VVGLLRRKDRGELDTNPQRKYSFKVSEKARKKTPAF
jgi:hypothetical protein